jgi:hypothetical protein
MKHSMDELFREVYRYYPRNGVFPATGAHETPEHRNRVEAAVQASAGYETWRAMLRRLHARFPEDRFPGVVLENRVPFLKPPVTSSSSRSFHASFWLPPRAGESMHWLAFFVSFVVPYHVVYSLHTSQDPAGKGDQVSFEPSPDEQPFAAAIHEEIERTYPGHAPMPPEIGMTVVPEIEAYGHGPGEKATLYDCLFDEVW